MYESASQEKKAILGCEFVPLLPQSLGKDNSFQKIGYCKGLPNSFKSDTCFEGKKWHWEK